MRVESIYKGAYVVSKLYKVYEKLPFLVYKLIDYNYKMVYKSQKRHN